MANNVSGFPTEDELREALVEARKHQQELALRVQQRRASEAEKDLSDTEQLNSIHKTLPYATKQDKKAALMSEMIIVLKGLEHAANAYMLLQDPEYTPYSG